MTSSAERGVDAEDIRDSEDAASAGPFRCTTASAARQEPMFATASRVDRWLLVEQPGPWGPETLPAGRMNPAAYAAMSQLARSYRARLLLIRRPSTAAPEDGITVFLAESRPGREWLMSRRVEDADELSRLAPPARDAAWQFETEPLYLVCTHGRHDPCCALFGRPVAGALCAREPDRTWESTHVGGDRFGANVVVLPHGLYLGRVIPGRVDEVVDAVRDRRIPLGLLRGRSSFSTAVQAAQHFLRGAASDSSGSSGTDLLDSFDDLLPLREEILDDSSIRVLLRGPDGPVAVTVRRQGSELAAKLTCHAPEPKIFPGFVLVGIQPVEIEAPAAN